jgi:hypothetical protein
MSSWLAKTACRISLGVMLNAKISSNIPLIAVLMVVFCNKKVTLLQITVYFETIKNNCPAFYLN